jgi:muramidase (phage lysozyme)
VTSLVEFRLSKSLLSDPYEHNKFMIRVQRKYKVIKANSLKDLEKEVNELIQKEYKDTEGFLYRASGRWQCLGSTFTDKDNWLQPMVFIQEEE